MIFARSSSVECTLDLMHSRAGLLHRRHFLAGNPSASLLSGVGASSGGASACEDNATLGTRGGTGAERSEASGGAERSEALQEGTTTPTEKVPIVFWGQNWRKGGLQERRNYLIKSCALYNQTWCGCEFSRHDNL